MLWMAVVTMMVISSLSLSESSGGIRSIICVVTIIVSIILIAIITITHTGPSIESNFNLQVAGLRVGAIGLLLLLLRRVDNGRGTEYA